MIPQIIFCVPIGLFKTETAVPGNGPAARKRPRRVTSRSRQKSVASAIYRRLSVVQAQ